MAGMAVRILDVDVKAPASGLARMQAAYAHAIRAGDRFHSNGAACLLERADARDGPGWRFAAERNASYLAVLAGATKRSHA